MAATVSPAVLSVNTEERYIEINEVSKAFDSNSVLDSFSLSVSRGEFITLLGPSGCGKTTLLRLIAGLLRVDAGTIRVNNQDLTRLPAHRRNVGMVFQSYALFPHLNVWDNIAFGLRAKGVNRATIKKEVGAAIDIVQLAELSSRWVGTLSGGQQQRVSLARAMVTKPAVMLLDEPFSALDRKLRENMQIETRQILRQINATALFVTHDQDEALVLSDRVAVMHHGQAVQVADPKTLYAAPASQFVLNFVGKSLRLNGRVSAAANGDCQIDTEIGPVHALNSVVKDGDKVLVAVRPEVVELKHGKKDYNSAIVKIRDIVFLGSKTQIFFHSNDANELVAEIPGPPLSGLMPGAEVNVRWPIRATLTYLQSE